MARQASAVGHSTFLGLTHPAGIELAEALVAWAPRGLTRVFYSDSGSTAVEVALKQAFQYWGHRGQPARQRFVRLEHAYHGDTLGAVGVGGIELFHRIFGPLITQSIPVRCPALYPDREVLGPERIRVQALAALEEILVTQGSTIAAVVMEPLIQGAAGMILHPAGYLRGVSDLCRKHDVLLIVDEVATGFGRTGSMFACEQEQVVPDFLCVAKGLTAGYLPLAATLSREEIYDAFRGYRRDMKTFFHGHTYTANPIACAVAVESLSIFAEEQVLDRSRARAEQLRQLLAQEIQPLPWVGDIRQRGLMIGIELVQDRETQQPFEWDQFQGAKVCEAIRAHGVILRPLGDVLVWMPPLSLTEEEAVHLARATREAIEATCR